MTTDATRAHHIDAERLAAWVDHGLPADEAAAVELHLSQCARCQDVLAAFARSAPASTEMVPAEVVPLLARRPVRWVVVGLAAAAVLAITVWNQRPPDAPEADSTVAADLSRTQPAPAPVAPSSAPPVAAPAPSPAARATEPARTRVRPAAKPPAGAVGTATAAAPVPASRALMPPPAVAPPPPPKPVFAPPPAASPPPVLAQPPPPAPVMAPPPAVTLPSPPPAMQSRPTASDAFGAEALGTIEIAAPVSVSQMFDTSARVAGRAGAGGGRAGGAAGRGGGGARWRIVAGTRVERTVDNGVTWTPVVIDPPLTTALTTGTATSPTVCWLAGRDGVVLVTADGVTFRRVSLPEVVQVIGVTAQDALRALVTVAGGRVFETTDGGATWRVR